MVCSELVSFFQALGNTLKAMNANNALIYALIVVAFLASTVFFTGMAIKMELKNIKPKKKQEKKPS